MSLLLWLYGFIFVGMDSVPTRRPTLRPTNRPSSNPTIAGNKALPCQTGTYNYFGSNNIWEVCDVLDNKVWIQAKSPNVGNYDMLSICQELGYTSVYKRRSVCSSYSCSYCAYGKSCSNPESWDTMWPANLYLWTSSSYLSGSNIAWVCQGIKGEPSRYILIII